MYVVMSYLCLFRGVDILQKIYAIICLIVQIGTGDRSERIRTYHWPRDQISDHRLGKTFPGVEKMLRGDHLANILADLKLDERLREMKLL